LKKEFEMNIVEKLGLITFILGVAAISLHLSRNYGSNQLLDIVITIAIVISAMGGLYGFVTGGNGK